MGDMKQIGEIIKERRRAQGLSQEALGKAVGVSRQQVFSWESGRDDPSIHRLAKLSEVLGVGIDVLLGRGSIPGSKGIPMENITNMGIATMEERHREEEIIKQAAEIIQKREAATRILDREKLIRDKVLHMPLCDVPPMPLVGVAAADEKQGREYDPNAVNGEVVINATNCRTVTVRGDSAKDYAWDGQQVIIDADRTAAKVGKPCIIYTKDGLLRLKRKTKSDNGVRTYESINRDYPPFEVSSQDVLAEWPVVGVITESRVRSPVETVNEGPPPKQLKPSTRKKNK